MQPAARRHGLIFDEALGTTAYMDPAYVASLTVTHKSDVYLLGVVLFEVLTGRKADFFQTKGNERNRVLLVFLFHSNHQGNLHKDSR
ncbi:putative non-specific serine/threonine protein kinase [Helianthus annuus]|nr:putative non-specific serine/threonine protein kinase [Helianthus annuus]